ncbi:hypothetical protein B0A55_02163 [Friedmanniomyces simplex]|uniref:Malic acid transport protein n=1 Tax=Friedmanniomyces simplex TaxID=329884 RepID=A0A4V5NKR2_9PEZI|nr:hypothetical protein B0A55_02163 [Friedmanniomyces simplex]
MPPPDRDGADPQLAVEPSKETDTSEDEQLRKVGLRDRILHFTWPWYSCTMSTGAVAVVLAQTPNRFAGLDTIGTIFFILDLVLFVSFTTAMVTRFIMFPQKLSESLHHPIEGLFFGAAWVSISLILNSMQAYGVPNCGAWLVEALKVLFWMYCAAVLLVAIFQYYIFFQSERLQVKDAVPAWVFPMYPLLVVAPMAGTMIPSQPTAAGYSMWVGAVMLQGLAWTVSIMVYAMYMQRLMTSELPSPPTRPGMYISVGPAVKNQFPYMQLTPDPGYTTAGLISLGTQAPNVLPSNAFGISNVPDGQVVRALGIIAGTFVIMFSVWFFFISSVAIVAGVKRMTFTLSWWAFVFPNAGLTLAAIQLGKAFSSPGINGRGYANIVKVEDQESEANAYVDEVWGLVYSLQQTDEDRLDVNEGVPFAYTKEDLKVDFWQAHHGSPPDTKEEPKQVEMLVYINRRMTTMSQPKKEYIYRMNQGIKDAVNQGMPKAYVETVMRRFIPDVEDEKVAEMAKKQALVFEDER